MIDDYNTTHEKEFDKLIELIRESVNEAFPGAEVSNKEDGCTLKNYL